MDSIISFDFIDHYVLFILQNHHEIPFLEKRIKGIIYGFFFFNKSQTDPSTWNCVYDEIA